MTYLIDYWDVETQSQKQREATLEELAQIEKDKEEHLILESKRYNENIKSQLETIDLRSIRALREGNVERITMLEAEASALRGLLREI